MRTTLLILFFLSANVLLYAQINRNYEQELFSLLQNGKNFEAREFKVKYKDQLPPNKALELLFNMHMSLAFNQSDSTIIYFEEFISNPDYGRNVAPLVGVYYFRLCETYEGKQQFDKAILTMERRIDNLKLNPYSLPTEVIVKELSEAENKISSLKYKLQFEPIRRVISDGRNTQINLKDGSYIRFDAQYNGHTVETFFDTGISDFCIMEKTIADEIGVKYKSNQNGDYMLKGRSIKANEGFIDSIELKGVKLFNIPVLVLADKFTSYLPSNINPNLRQNLEQDLLKSRQVLCGLAVMKLIGKIEIDWKSNTLTFLKKDDHRPAASKWISNLMLVKNGAYLNMQINKTDFIGFLDLAGDYYLFLTYSYFFESNSDYIRHDTQKPPFSRIGFFEVQENIERYRVNKPVIDFDGRTIDIIKYQKDIYTVAGNNNFDGLVGLKFFKNTFSKTIIDFSSMTIRCED